MSMISVWWLAEDLVGISQTASGQDIEQMEIEESHEEEAQGTGQDMVMHGFNVSPQYPWQVVLQPNNQITRGDTSI